MRPRRPVVCGGMRLVSIFAKKALPFKPGKPVPVDALKAKHAIRESFEAAQIYDQLLADFHRHIRALSCSRAGRRPPSDFVEKRKAVLEKADLIAAAQELFEVYRKVRTSVRLLEKWVDAQEIRDEQEREKKTLDDIGTGGAPIIRSAPHDIGTGGRAHHWAAAGPRRLRALRGFAGVENVQC